MNIFKNPYYRANLSKSGFDCSSLKQFSTIPGFLQPFHVDVLSPGESIKLDDNVFMRTENMTTSPFTRIRFKTEYFFVPFPQLWSYFGSMYYGIKDINSAALGMLDENVRPMYPCVSSLSLSSYASFLDDNFDEDFHGVSLASSLHRLLDGFGQYIKVKNITNLRNYPLYFAQAYQRIFDAFYRNDLYESKQRASYNVDDIEEVLDFDSGDEDSILRFGKLFAPHYRPMPKDYFTNIQPSPIFNSLTIDSFRSSIGEFKPGPGSSDLNLTDSNSDYVNESAYAPQQAYAVGDGNQSQAAVVSTSLIRNMFAVEKLLQITQRTKKQYDAQTLAHFGYDVPDDVANKVYYIGSHDGIVQISDVNATATTSGEDSSLLGQIAGKGIGISNNNNKPLKFTAPYHGVFMAIFSVYNDVVYPDYAQSDLASMIYREDFYHPEFDRLGMTPSRAINYLKSPSSSSIANKVLAWQYRYSHLKTSFDRCWGNFMSTNKNWTSKRLMFETQTIPLSFFYYSPSSLDDILLHPFVPLQTFDDAYNSDPFDVEIDLKLYKSSTMSTYGLPSL